MGRKTASSAAILEVLHKYNYMDWSIRVKTYLMSQDVWDIVEATTMEPPKQEDGAALKVWSKKNSMALHIIQNSCGTDTFYEIRKIVSAKIAWDTLAEMYNHVPKDTNSVVREVLDEGNYEDWSDRVKSYLKAYDLWDVVEVIIEPTKQEDDNQDDAFKAWNKKNLMALSVIQNSCGRYTFSHIREITSAKIAWDTLARIHNVPKNTNSVVREVLDEDNYKDWSARLKTYLMAHDLWDMIIEQTTEPNKQEDDGIAFEAWNKKNLIALDAIKNSCGPKNFSYLQKITSAKIAWDTLAEKYSGTYGDGGYLMYGGLHKAVRSGNLTDAKEFLQRRPNAVGARITHKGDTALHIAVAAGHFRLVEELVKRMAEANLETLDYDGFSALTEAAVGGKKAMAQCMLSKNRKLISIASSTGILPVNTAISFGHIETARYLYSLTPLEDLMPERSYNGANLFIDAISAGTLDIALDLLQRYPRFTIANNGFGNSPLLALASTAHLFPSGSRLVFWKRWIYKYCDSIINETRLNIQKIEKQRRDQVNTIISGSHVQSADSIINETRLNIQKVEKQRRDQVNTIISVRALLRHLLSNVLKFLGIEQLYEMKLIHVQSRELLRQMCEEISNSNEQQRMDSCVCDAFILAIKSGIVEFVFEMLRKNPDLVWIRDERNRNIFSLAVLNRQAEILSRLFELHWKEACSLDCTIDGMLHMAALSAESTILNRIPGAALQMQNELQWFKEVETIVHPKIREATIKDGLTHRELFTNNHKALLKMGEQWMKETATSCTVVGALIVTIMFAAAFTIPGGNKQDTGLPLFLEEELFMVYIISDALSFFSSSTSVLMFSGILTARYGEEDFIKSLPTKMIIGLSTLFFSIVTMMITFSAALLIMLREQSWIVGPIICLAGVPVALFVRMQFRPLVEIFSSTYGSGIFDRKIKPICN